ncbi:hypothetical protein [Caloramator sp. Dgby_cultured_2]|uniref:hypothetical protein n=1 Tax=Caloramator sp. Dgby_cultured_2 TaxID=3029174 RepID=UPI00237DD8C3|nr:hypothetical protein [Caloramator sp. Dgby_cultured_2]WDU82813.1 hypothetical protein PWK10_15095 [Caloramator sp. Dgby_cultured_2]
MLSELNFQKGINKLINEYQEKGFNPNAARLKQWYEYMKDMSDEEFNKRIDWVLKNVSYSPSMADIFKADISSNNTWKDFDFSFLEGGDE